MTTPERYQVIQCSYSEMVQRMSQSELGARTAKGLSANDTYIIIYHNECMIRVEPLYHKDMISMLEQAYLMGLWDKPLPYTGGSTGKSLRIKPDTEPATERVRS